jgi:hypothetical protein
MKMETNYEIQMKPNGEKYTFKDKSVLIVRESSNKEDHNPRTDASGTIILGEKIGKYSGIIEEQENHVGYPVMLPVYLLDHSGVSIKTTPYDCNYDSGQIGRIVMTQESFDNDFEQNREEAEKYLQREIDNLNDFLQGYVFEIEFKRSTQYFDGFLGCDVLTNGILDELPEKYKKEFLKGKGL